MNTGKRHIVLITTWYPPLEGIAVNRMSAFAKYLDRNSYRVTVLTLGNDHTYGLEQVGEDRVFRVRPKRTVWNPPFKSTDSRFAHLAKTGIRKIGMKIGAFKDKHFTTEAVKYLFDLHSKDPVDLVISSFSPVEPHLVALQFCRKTSVRWIVDMRDEMSMNPQADQSTRAYLSEIEKEINKTATALISVSAPIVAYFRDVIPDLRFYVEIRNGYEVEPVIRENHFNEQFTLLHAGSFYGTRKPDTLFKALVRLDEAGELPEKWRFVCAGAARNFMIPEQLKSHVEILPRVDHNTSIELMAAADVNVLIQPPTGRKGVFTGKIFEYLSVVKPVLAVVDKQDVAAVLVRDLNAGYTAEFGDIDEICASLKLAVENWKNKTLPGFDRLQIQQLHRKYQVQKLNLLIGEVLK